VIVMIGLFWPTITIVTAPRPSARIEVAGAQLEFPGVPEVIVGLNRLMEAHPEAQLILLSEYTFDGPVPPQVKTWCQKHGKWLVVGGKQSITGELGGGAARKSEDRYYNMAFVISPTGEMVFSQAKSRPI